MNLSGWSRLWIVASAIWWAAGSWWLADNFRPTKVEVAVVDAAADVVATEGGSEAFSEAEVSEIRRRYEERSKAAAEAAAQLEARREQDGYSPLDLMADMDRLRATSPRTLTSLDAGSEIFAPRATRDDWTSWIFALAVVIVVPFAAGLTFISIRIVGLWVWRGFRRPRSSAGPSGPLGVQFVSLAPSPEPEASIEARNDVTPKEGRKPKLTSKPNARDGNRYGSAEKAKKRGLWTSLGIFSAALLAVAAAQIATSVTKAVLPKPSAMAPATIEPLAPSATPAPDGFTNVTLEDGAIRFHAPSTWPVIDTALFAEAEAIAASMLGASGGQQKAIYSAAVSQIAGMEPAATINVLLESGPAPTQPQVRDRLSQRDPDLIDLPKKTAAFFSEMNIPNVHAEWTDNGKLLCLHIRAEMVVNRISKISDQWNCYNSSTAVTLVSVYDADAAATYAPIVRHVFDSLDLAIDHTIRLR